MTNPPSSPKHHDAIIFGGGLAGTILAERLHSAGKQILLVNDPQKSRCSRVAAGLINPIGGKRLKLIWQAGKLIPHAKAYYQELESKFGKQFFHPRSIHRELVNDQEKSFWQKRLDDPNYQRWVGDSAEDHFTIPEAGYLDTNTLLDTIHGELQSQDRLLSSSFNYDDISVTESAVEFRGRTARHAIFAEGHLATGNPHFQFVPYKPAKGIIASIKLVGACLSRDSKIIIKGKFIVPRHDGIIQVGATYNWDDASDTPDEAGVAEIESFLNQHFGPGNWSFEQIRAGVRPATAGAYPVVGPHPETPQIIAFNGFGSKGSLQIPYFAGALSQHLQIASAASTDTQLPSETLPSRFLKTKNSKPKRWIATEVAKAEVLKHLSNGDLVIDATAGNGHDTQWLAESVTSEGHVFAFDIQTQALETTRQRLEKHQLDSRVTLYHAGHENLLETIPSEFHGNISSIVFNLGFLPGGDPTLITKSDTTIQALKASLQLLKPGGLLSITLYPTHSGAQEEVELVLSWFNDLFPEKFSTYMEPHPQGNPHSPYPIFVRKKP
ncbi:FAD-dependent oxidoreductase [Pelagicoccus mobilis]|uniref:FAD-dependent oxidoreductase n=1 Tax=Pelagicoccus mobilis TaxID=415221 RepID=A0A934VSV0_9BACT|nr:FAD-dependent oxidoreductase [Pelagicoccus mobilis]MBK1879395.1 FAD-dependent oxidoreductase [Pelagicoccus mobilis]